MDTELSRQGRAWLHCLNEPRSLPRRLCDDVVPVRSTRADGHGEMVEQWDDTTCISYGCNYILWAGGDETHDTRSV